MMLAYFLIEVRCSRSCWGNSSASARPIFCPFGWRRAGRRRRSMRLRAFRRRWSRWCRCFSMKRSWGSFYHRYNPFRLLHVGWGVPSFGMRRRRWCCFMNCAYFLKLCIQASFLYQSIDGVGMLWSVVINCIQIKIQVLITTIFRGINAW